MNELADYPGEITQAGTTCSTDPSAYCPAPVRDGCEYQYKTPVVQFRYVGFGGSSPNLTQEFAYATNWDAPLSGNTLGITWHSKVTSVSSTDPVRGTQLTTYTYTPTQLPADPYSHESLGPQIPEESSIAYTDWGGTNVLRTVNKHWTNLFALGSEQTVLSNGQSSTVNYFYGPFNVMTGKDEYDFGASSQTRMTRVAYQSFLGAPGDIADKACTIVVCSSGSSCSTTTSNKVSEIDNLYDGSTGAACGPSGTASTSQVGGLPSGTHDESLFAPTSTTPRGNVTQRTLWENNGPSPVTKYAYDETGQVTSKVDACGNGSCTSDMTGSNHTTQYFYTDSFTTGSNTCSPVNGPSGNTNSYLTKITYPTTANNGTAITHSQCFSYDFTSGQLTGTKDQNGQLTTYGYADPFFRPRSVSYPDGGQTTISYSDSAPSPSVTTTKLISSSIGSLSTTSIMDGMGHVVQNQVTTDPDAQMPQAM